MGIGTRAMADTAARAIGSDVNRTSFQPHRLDGRNKIQKLMLLHRSPCVAGLSHSKTRRNVHVELTGLVAMVVYNPLMPAQT
ncbi:MAG TPA: hypothetical protein DDZ51_09520 [Planctomycetaceae bacterium]|nr:hypothetical protein [Planctomycetaceae bacterium]